jgi:hypothetical protein
MAVVVKSPLMAAHVWQVDLDYNADVRDRLTEVVDGYRRPRKIYARIRDADDVRRYPTLVLTAVGGDERGLAVGGLGPAWHMGTPGGPGPIMRDMEFISGVNFLDNPTFTEDLQLLYWKASQDTGWEWNAASHDAGVGGAYVGTSPAKDDVLETREYPAEPGQQFFFFGWFIRGPGSLGRIRLRTIYRGRLTPPDIASPYSAWGPDTRGDITLTTDPEGVVPGPVFEMRTGIANLIPDFEFDGGVPSADWDDLSGVWGQGTDGGWNGTNYAYTDVDPGIGIAVLQSLLPLGIVEGEEYEMRIVIRANPGSPATDGEAWAEVALTDDGTPPFPRIGTTHARGPMTTTDWNIFVDRFTVPDGQLSMTLLLNRQGGTTGRWDYDTPTIIRTKGNYDQVISPAEAVTPERTYRWTPPYRVDAGVTGGRAQLRAVFFGDGRPEIYVEGPELKGQQQALPLQYATWDLTPPSGYTAVERRLYSEDIVGGAVWVGEGTFVDTDRSTYVVDEITGHLQATWLLRELVTTAPAGTETVSFAFVAEKDAIGWLADDFTAVRWATPHASHTDVLNAILTNQDTGDPLPITLGSVVDPGVIPYDWHALNLFNRDALAWFSEVVASPWGEWYIDNDDALHWAPAGSLFVDHHPDSATPVVLLPRDLDVVPGGISGVRSDVENRATHIEVIGADVATGGGRSMLIKATAAVPIPPEYDLNGNVIQRWRQVNDGSIDSRLFAQAVADDEALREARPAITVTAKLNELDADTAATLGVAERPPFAEGDTVYAYYPEAGLRHEDYETEVGGETVWPRPVQVLGIERSHAGPGWRIEMVEPDGSTWDLPGVIWSAAEETTLTLGDRLPVWKADPMGLAAGRQYLSDRKARRR